MASALLGLSSERKLSSRLTQQVFFILGLSLLVHTGGFYLFEFRPPPVLSVTDPFQAFLGPVFLYHLGRAISLDKARFFRTHLLAPGLLLLLAAIENFVLLWGQQFTIPWRILHILLQFAIYIQLCLYVYICRRALRDFSNSLKKNCSYIELRQESWLGKILLALLFAHFAMTFIYLLNHGSYRVPVNFSLAIIFCGLIFYLAFLTVRYPELLVSRNETNTKIDGSDFEGSGFKGDRVERPGIEKPAITRGREEPVLRYEKSSLTPEQAANALLKVRDTMRDAKPYLDPELSLNSLAKSVGMSSHHLSQILNGEEGKSFYDFVNAYRIENAKDKLAATEDSILDIAFASGFNSKATFNRLFKKFCGQTPTQFRRSR